MAYSWSPSPRFILFDLHPLFLYRKCVHFERFWTSGVDWMYHEHVRDPWNRSSRLGIVRLSCQSFSDVQFRTLATHNRIGSFFSSFCALETAFNNPQQCSLFVPKCWTFYFCSKSNKFTEKLVSIYYCIKYMNYQITSNGRFCCTKLML